MTDSVSDRREFALPLRVRTALEMAARSDHSRVCCYDNRLATTRDEHKCTCHVELARDILANASAPGPTVSVRREDWEKMRATLKAAEAQISADNCEQTGDLRALADRVRELIHEALSIASVPDGATMDDPLVIEAQHREYEETIGERRKTVLPASPPAQGARADEIARLGREIDQRNQRLAYLVLGDSTKSVTGHADDPLAILGGTPS